MVLRGLLKALKLPAGAKPDDWVRVIGVRPGSTVVQFELKSKGLTSATMLQQRLKTYSAPELTAVLGPQR